MALTKGWINHLAATRAAIDAAIEEIERIGRKGLPPAGGSGQPLTPLPEEEWRRIENSLTALKQEMDSLIRLLAPDEAERHEQRQPASATRFYLSMALTMLQQQVIDDLVARRSDRYGALGPQDREALESTAGRMRNLIDCFRRDTPTSNTRPPDD